MGQSDNTEGGRVMAQLMYGKNVVKQMLKNPSKVNCVYMCIQDPQIEAECARNKIRLKHVSRNDLKKMTGSDNHQGIAAEVEEYRLYSLDDLVNERHSDYGFLILLDELEDPHNLGAVLRTADAVGADGVIFKKTHAVGLTPAVAKVSAGAIDTVKCASVTNLARTAEELKKKGYWIVGADMDGQDYRSLKYNFNTVLVIGNEGKGISRLLREKCDYLVSLPMRGKISSLNAAVSAGILMYQITDGRFFR